MIHIGSVGGGGGSRASTHGAVHKWFPEDKVQDHHTGVGVWQHPTAGTNCVFRLHWWYLLVIGSCMQCSMVFSSGGKYPSWYVVPHGWYRWYSMGQARKVLVERWERWESGCKRQ